MQPVKREKIFAKNISDLELMYKIYEEFLQSNHHQKKNIIMFLTTYLNKDFSKEDNQMANKHMKRCSASLITREIHIKTLLRYHFIHIKLVIIKKVIQKKREKKPHDNRMW